MRNKFKSLLLFKSKKEELFILTSARAINRCDNFVICDGIKIEVPNMNFIEYFVLNPTKFVELTEGQYNSFLSDGIVETVNKTLINDSNRIIIPFTSDTNYSISFIDKKVDRGYLTSPIETIGSINSKKETIYSDMPFRRKKERVVTFENDSDLITSVVIDSYSIISKTKSIIACDGVEIEVPYLKYSSKYTKTSKYLVKLNDEETDNFNKDRVICSKRKFSILDVVIVKLCNRELYVGKVSTITKDKDNKLKYLLCK